MVAAGRRRVGRAPRRGASLVRLRRQRLRWSRRHDTERSKRQGGRAPRTATSRPGQTRRDFVDYIAAPRLQSLVAAHQVRRLVHRRWSTSSARFVSRRPRRHLADHGPRVSRSVRAEDRRSRSASRAPPRTTTARRYTPTTSTSSPVARIAGRIAPRARLYLDQGHEPHGPRHRILPLGKDARRRGLARRCGRLRAQTSTYFGLRGTDLACRTANRPTPPATPWSTPSPTGDATKPDPAKVQTKPR